MFSEREINAANSVGIKELVSSLGYKPKKIGNNEYYFLILNRINGIVLKTPREVA